MCVLRPFRLWLWSETLFRHLPKRTFTAYRNSSGSLAMLAAIRRASSRMSGPADARHILIIDVGARHHGGHAPGSEPVETVSQAIKAANS